ncbi:MAG: TipAS antibiotic-recognition domain-containing protein [Acutalibacteraceae bacterium]|nr:TipAS antibiotic-recognition domain-containing protein [Acutalibacteraceae bacterium]
MSKHQTEVYERWGNTAAYKEYKEKTAEYSADKHLQASHRLNTVLAKFAALMQSGHTPDSREAQGLVKELQITITEKFYTCTEQILAGLGKMYVADERFKENIDKNGKGTAEFVSQAIEIYCSSLSK